MSKTPETPSDATSEEAVAFANFLETHYEYAEQSQVAGCDVEPVFHDHFRSTRSFQRFAAWLDGRPGITRKRSNGTKYRGIRERQTAQEPATR